MVFHQFCRFMHVHAESESSQVNTKIPVTNTGGWGAVTSLWKRLITAETEYGDVNLVRNTYISGGLIGFFGGIFASKKAMQDFIRKHNDYTFKGEFEARRRLTDYVTIKVLTTGWKTSWRLSLFSGTLMLVAMSAVTYRNNVYISDFCASAALTGGLWKVKLGLKGAFSGAVVAGTFGLICGCIFKLYIMATRTNMSKYMSYLRNEYTTERQREKMIENKKHTEEYDKRAFEHLLQHEQRLEKVKTEILWTEGFFEQNNETK